MLEYDHDQIDMSDFLKREFSDETDERFLHEALRLVRASIIEL
jgi:hypothetical protein